MENLELFPEEMEEEEAVAEEGANRTFIILVGALGGLLAMGLCMFAVWAFVINPKMTASRVEYNQSVEATNTAQAQGAAEVAGDEPPTETVAPTVVPSDTPQPTPTRSPTETPTTAAEEATAQATPAEVATGPTAAAVQGEATATPKPTPTRRPTATKSAQDEMPGTGVGTLGVSALAIGLLFLLVAVRRVRRAV